MATEYRLFTLCDLIVLNVENADDGNFFITEFNNRFVLIVVKQGIVLTVFDVEAGDAEGVFYRVSQNLRALYEEDRPNFFALKRAAITFEVATGNKFDTPEKIKNVKFTENVPVLMLAGIRDILCDPVVRNENLSIRSSVSSKKNYRRHMLKALNPLIKQGHLKFDIVDVMEVRLDFLGKDKAPVFNFCYINPIEKTIVLNRSSTLFSFISPMDKESYTYKEFSEFFVTVVEDVKTLLGEYGYTSPSDELVYQFIFLTGSRIFGELTRGGLDATVLRHYITISEALVFLKHNFSVKQILRVYSLYMPVDQLSNFKDAPDEWLEVIDREYDHPIIKQLLQNQPEV